MKDESKDLRRTIHLLMWHMRGGLTREEAWTLSLQERDDMRHFIEDRMKIVEKTGLPLI